MADLMSIFDSIFNKSLLNGYRHYFPAAETFFMFDFFVCKRLSKPIFFAREFQSLKPSKLKFSGSLSHVGESLKIGFNLEKRAHVFI